MLKSGFFSKRFVLCLTQDEEFYLDHWYLHPDFDETKCSCEREIRKKKIVLFTRSVVEDGKT